MVWPLKLVDKYAKYMQIYQEDLSPVPVWKSGIWSKFMKVKMTDCALSRDKHTSKRNIQHLKKHETNCYKTADIKVSCNRLLLTLLVWRPLRYHRYNHCYLFEISSNKHQVKYFPADLSPRGIKILHIFIHDATHLQRGSRTHTHIHYFFLQHTVDEACLSDLSLTHTHTVSLLSRLELQLQLPFVIQTESFSLHCCLNDVFNLLFVTTNNLTNNCFLKYSAS